MTSYLTCIMWYILAHNRNQCAEMKFPYSLVRAPLHKNIWERKGSIYSL